MEKQTNTLTILFLIKFVSDQISEFIELKSLSEDDQYRLNSIGQTVEVLKQAARSSNDLQIFEILDDFEYVVNEIMMGASVKGRAALNITLEKINQLKLKNLSEN